MIKLFCLYFPTRLIVAIKRFLTNYFEIYRVTIALKIFFISLKLSFCIGRAFSFLRIPYNPFPFLQKVMLKIVGFCEDFPLCYPRYMLNKYLKMKNRADARERMAINPFVPLCVSENYESYIRDKYGY
jgi:hypothetical protein